MCELSFIGSHLDQKGSIQTRRGESHSAKVIRRQFWRPLRERELGRTEAATGKKVERYRADKTGVVNGSAALNLKLRYHHKVRVTCRIWRKKKDSLRIVEWAQMRAT